MEFRRVLFRSARPNVIDGPASPRPDDYPKPFGNNICRNAIIQATFDRPMQSDSFRGNVIVAMLTGNNGADSCQAGSQYLTVAPRPTFIFKVKSFLARLPL